MRFGIARIRKLLILTLFAFVMVQWMISTWSSSKEISQVQELLELCRAKLRKEPLHYGQVPDADRLLDETKACLELLDRKYYTDLQILEEEVLRESRTPDEVEEKDRSKRKIWDEAVKFFTLSDDEPRHSYVNLHKFTYPITSTVCSVGSPDVLILVHSKADHFSKRNNVRQTWGKRGIGSEGKLFRPVFFLAMPKLTGKERDVAQTDGVPEEVWTADVTQKVQREAYVYGDIVMGDFLDTYRNLTIKHVMTLSWAVSHCPETWFFLKVDDDVLVNPFNVVRYLNKVPFKANSVFVCETPKDLFVIRDFHRLGNTGPVSKQEYPFPLYPPWCDSVAQFMSHDVLVKLFKATRDLRYFWYEDIYVTGLAAWRIGISPQDPPEGHAMSGSMDGEGGMFTSLMVTSPDQSYHDEDFLGVWGSLVEQENARRRLPRAVVLHDLEQFVFRSFITWRNPWVVSMREYPFPIYPPWCRGFGTLMSRDVVEKLFRSTANLRYFWIDDVYVTGLGSWKAEITLQEPPEDHDIVEVDCNRDVNLTSLMVFMPCSYSSEKLVGLWYKLLRRENALTTKRSKKSIKAPPWRF